MDGIILIDKEKDWTSQDVCSKAKHILHVDKIGHCGTLDPFATGLLVVLINKATKLGQFIETFDKTYIARLKLGVKTNSADVNGEVILTKNAPKLTIEEIKRVFSSFIGKQKQIPPMYSAIKVDGKPLYKYAREGFEIERKAKDIEIFDLQLIDYDCDNNIITFMTHVSKGTYIRTLGEDIAQAFDTVGHLLDLRRTRVGRYLVNNAKTIDKISQDDILPFKKCLTFIKNVIVSEKTKKDVKNGKKVVLSCEDKLVALFDYDDNLLAIYTKEDDHLYRSLRGFF